MKILISNDDGIKSESIKLLFETLSKEHDVFVIAPDRNRSAVSHHFTMYSENCFVKIKDRFWASSGYPSDCVFAGIAGAINDYEDISEELKNKPFDVVITGINYGPNLGSDIIYSGTCAGARQALLKGIPAIAVSLDPVDWNNAEFKFQALVDFLVKNLEQLVSLAKLDCPRAFVNVNAISADKYKGVKFCKELCVRNYTDSIKLKKISDLYKAENQNQKNDKNEINDIKQNKIQNILQESARHLELKSELQSELRITQQSTLQPEINAELKSEKPKNSFFVSEFISGLNEKADKTQEKSDFSICRDGYIAISLVYADPVCFISDYAEKCIDDMHI